MNDERTRQGDHGRRAGAGDVEERGSALHDPVAPLEARLGIRFGDAELVRRAFVHRSFVNELPEGDARAQDNERLEFLGDAALGLVVSDIVYRRFGTYSEGELTRVRSLIVRRETLAELANKLRLGDYLRLGRGEDESGGRTRPAILCATFEAVVGAIYLDQGLGTVQRVVAELLDDLFSRWRRDYGFKDAKSRLQEWSQSEFGVAPRYKVVEQSGPDHAKTFTIQVSILQQRIGVGAGMSKQEASQRAAQMALTRLGEMPPSEDANEPGLAAAWDVPEDALAVLQSAAAPADAPPASDPNSTT